MIIRILLAKCLNTRNGFPLCLDALWAEFSIKVKFQCHLLALCLCSLMNLLSDGVMANSWSMAISESVNYHGHLTGGHLFFSPESQRLTSPSTRTLGTDGAFTTLALWLKGPPVLLTYAKLLFPIGRVFIPRSHPYRKPGYCSEVTRRAQHPNCHCKRGVLSHWWNNALTGTGSHLSHNH